MRNLSRIGLWAVALAFSWAALSPITAGPVWAAGSGVTGTWVGEATIDGRTSRMTMQLHERASGEVIGYIAGDTSSTTIISGQVSGGNLTLVIGSADPMVTMTSTVTAVVGASTLTGAVDDGSGPYPIIANRVNQTLHERRFVFAIPGVPNPTGMTELSVVLDGSGNFVSGGFMGMDNCDLFACGGGVSSFSETGGMIEIGLESGGGCTMAGAMSATFDSATKFYDGTYTVNHCGTVTSGVLIGAKGTRTRTDHVAKVLSTHGRLADDLEAGIAFGASHASFDSAYLHDGEILADRLAELNGQVADYNAIEVEFSRFRNVVTVVEPDIHPFLDQPFGVDFHDRRTGIPVGEAAAVEFRNTDTGSGADELKYLVKRGSRWLIHGNQAIPPVPVVHDIPFADYVLAGDHVILPTAGGDIYMSIGPWGGHALPHTGHVEGNPKADWAGQYAWTLDQLVELDGNGNGICEDGETCGVSGADIDARRTDFIATMEGMVIEEVRLEFVFAPNPYYASPEQWVVRGRVGDYTYLFGHIDEISQDLRDRMVAAGYTDPWTVHTVSANLITGDPVPVNMGDTLARPQVAAQEMLPDHPGYYTGQWGFPETPWQEIEFKTFNNREMGREESFYTLLPPALEADLAGILEESAPILDELPLKPLAFRYNQPHLDASRWKAEMSLSNADFRDGSDYSSLFSALGGWWKTLGDDCPNPATCYQIFSIYPIQKDTAFYDPGLYPPDVSYLTAFRQPGEFGDVMMFGDVISPIEPDPISGSMVIRWKVGSLNKFQGVSYLLNPGTKVLKIARGPLEALEADAIPPLAPLDGDLCDGVTLVCYSHDHPTGLYD